MTALTFAPALAKTDSIIYAVNQLVTKSATESITVTGTITSDGVLGSITANDLTGYDLFLTDTVGSQTATVELGSALSQFRSVAGNGTYTATAGALSFDFSQGNYLVFAGYGSGFVEFNLGAEQVNNSNFYLVTVPEGGVQTIGTVADATPEPSSLLLLGTGALAMAGAVRRRLVG